MVKGFVLPEGFASLAEDLVSLKRGITLENLGDFLKWQINFKQKMDVVRHDHVS